jgi:hypothetical protein
VRRSGEDRKWRELAGLLGYIFTAAAIPNDTPSDASPNGANTIPPPKPSPRQKLLVFTEHRDTLSYLETRVTTLLGRKEAVVVIHGGMGREERLKAQESFKHHPEVNVLIATDAAGEGINLQRAHLMVNYDLPWNPNRIEQRFGRIHRIGQTEVCHLWNLVFRSNGASATIEHCCRAILKSVLTQLWCTRGTCGTLAGIDDKSVISRKSLLRSEQRDASSRVQDGPGLDHGSSWSELCCLSWLPIHLALAP